MSRLPSIVLQPLQVPLPRAALPWLLIALRLGVCPLLLTSAAAGWSRIFLLFLLSLGVLSDVFDGIIARRLKVSTPRLRRADSLIDVFFWLSVLAAAQHLDHFISRNLLMIALLLASEVLCQIVSQIRFGHPPATHSYAAKAWGLLMFAGFGLDFLSHGTGVTDLAMLAFGILVNIEVVGIMLLSKEQPIDVASIWPLLRRTDRPDSGRVMFGDRI